MASEETLAVLHGWLGRELAVAIQTSEGMVVANSAGPLAAGSDLSARGQAGPIFFQLGGVGATGFFIGEPDFCTGWWVDKEQTLLGVSRRRPGPDRLERLVARRLAGGFRCLIDWRSRAGLCRSEIAP